jgi:hypothetical protein
MSAKIYDDEGRLVGVSFSDLAPAPKNEMADEADNRSEPPAENTNAEAHVASAVATAKPVSRAPSRVGARSAAEPIGNRNPPRSACFKPGVSGNPKGRPKGQSLREIFLKTAAAGMRKGLADYVEADPNGTKLEAAISSLFRRAHYGDASALRQVLALQREFGSDDAAGAEAGNEVLGADFVPASRKSG